MNIFVTSPCPVQSAEYLDDKRLVKMVLETAQILSTVIYLESRDYHDAAELYKPTHQNHPCVAWVFKNDANYNWLYRHFVALCDEYESRYNRKHKSREHEYAFCRFKRHDVPQPSSFVNCAANRSLDLDYTAMTDVHAAYMLYLSDRWDMDKRQPTWGGRG